MPCLNRPLGMGEWWSWIKRGQLHCLRKISGNVSLLSISEITFGFYLGSGIPAGAMECQGSGVGGGDSSDEGREQVAGDRLAD